MNIVMPKQHGAWAMLIVPFWLGVAASVFHLGHISLFLGWFFLYLASYAALMLVKGKKKGLHVKWTLIYFSFAALFLIFPVLQQPKLILFGLALLPLLVVSAYYSARNQDRALLNDISAIGVFSAAGMASYFYGEGRLDEHGLFVALISFLFFLGSTFYVKTMIREKNSAAYRNVSWGYHGLVVLWWGITGAWLVSLAFLPSLFRAYMFYGKKLPVIKVGIYEIVNAVVFFVISVLVVR